MNLSDAYYKIKLEWDGKYSQRSNVPLMEHIDEGLKLLENSEEIIKVAWCLHPFIQKDDWSILNEIDNKTANILLEYRHWANGWDSHTTAKFPDEWPILSLISDEVKLLLFVDKTHNSKQYHENREKFRKEDQIRLDKYFENWITLLKST